MDSKQSEQDGANGAYEYDAGMPPSYNQASQKEFSNLSQAENYGVDSKKSDEGVTNPGYGHEASMPPPYYPPQQPGQGAPPPGGNPYPPTSAGYNYPPQGYPYHPQGGHYPQQHHGGFNMHTSSNVVVVNQPMTNQAYIHPPADQMTGAVLACFFCCCITGIMAIMKAKEARELTQAGDFVNAHTAANSARRLIKISVMIGTIFTILYVVGIILRVVFYSSTY